MKRFIIHIILLIAAFAIATLVFFLSQRFYSTEAVKLYYYNPDRDRDAAGDIMCSRQGLVAVEREISRTPSPIRDTIDLLLKGELTVDERNQGITTEYPLEDVTMKNVVLQDGVLTLTFEDPLYRTSGGSCRVGILWFQIEATAKQFPEVQAVRFLPEELFQP
jgi:spore germination protein GerM